MALNIACLNVDGLRNLGKAARLLQDLLYLDVDLAVIEETHFIEARDARVLSDD